MKSGLGLLLCMVAVLGMCAPVLIRSADQRVQAVAVGAGLLGLGAALVIIVTASGG